MHKIKQYVLLLELLEVQPEVWRSIHIDGRIRLDALHHILQAAMGWSDSRPHRFEIHQKFYIPTGSQDAESDFDTFAEKEYRLDQLMAVGDTCDYLYDFEDGWHHRIRVEAITGIDIPEKGVGLAWIEAGARACPPEDVGGARGYQDLLDTLGNEAYRDDAWLIGVWAGVDFDPERFNRQSANAAIERMLKNGWIKIGA